MTDKAKRSTELRDVEQIMNGLSAMNRVSLNKKSLASVETELLKQTNASLPKGWCIDKGIDEAFLLIRVGAIVDDNELTDEWVATINDMDVFFEFVDSMAELASKAEGGMVGWSDKTKKHAYALEKEGDRSAAADKKKEGIKRRVKPVDKEGQPLFSLSELEHMRYHQPLYKQVKAILKEQGHWKDKPKGGSFGKGNPYRFTKP